MKLSAAESKKLAKYEDYISSTCLKIKETQEHVAELYNQLKEWHHSDEGREYVQLQLKYYRSRTCEHN